MGKINDRFKDKRKQSTRTEVDNVYKDVFEQERITKAAILRHDQIVVSLDRPARHADIIRKLDSEGYEYNEDDLVYGFMTSNGRFVGRAAAAEIAYRARQINNQLRYLTTDDVW